MREINPTAIRQEIAVTIRGAWAFRKAGAPWEIFFPIKEIDGPVDITPFYSVTIWASLR
jgi:hypothetical protein